jgi:hypothetical protein
MVAGVFAGNISAEATTPTGNTFDEATRGPGHQSFKLLIYKDYLASLGESNRRQAYQFPRSRPVFAGFRNGACLWRGYLHQRRIFLRIPPLFSPATTDLRANVDARRHHA